MQPAIYLLKQKKTRYLLVMGNFKCYAFLNRQVNDRFNSQPLRVGLTAGYANGYVAIPKEHPLYNVSYDDVDIDIHGGLTFAEMSDSVNKVFEQDKIEYLDGELPNGYWVFGFDTMHWGDNISTRPREWCVNETIELKRILENW